MAGLNGQVFLGGFSCCKGEPRENSFWFPVGGTWAARHFSGRDRRAAERGWMWRPAGQKPGSGPSGALNLKREVKGGCASSPSARAFFFFFFFFF